MNFVLKPDLLLGVSASAAQIEGGDQNSSWYNWYRQGHIKDDTDPSTATDHWERWREDVNQMAEMGISCCRMSIAWSRVEPEDGVFDEEVLAHYRQELEALRERNIRPLLTLHHFSNPIWLEERGAFAKSDNITCFLRYVHKVVESLGDLVSEYITINEPNVYAFQGYLQGIWPPGRRNPLEMGRVLTNLTAAHIEAYGLIRKTRLQMGFSDTKVSFANALRVFSPADPKDAAHRFWAARAEQIYQGSLTRAMCTGIASFPIGSHPSIVPGRYCDFHAINYYSRSVISGPAHGKPDHCPVSDLGWEIYPAGIVETAQWAYNLLPRPIYITENGVCDREDRFRARFIADHLQAICASDLPIVRYYHWCFCDNWEWLEGLSAPFGLVRVDRDSGERQMKDSGRFYQRLIAEGGVSEALYQAYCTAPYPVE